MLFANINRAIARAQDEQRERESAQVSLFAAFSGEAAFRPDTYAPAESRWTQREVLASEKEVLGFYVSGHPLDHFASELAKMDVRALATLKDPEFLNNAPMRSRPNADPNAVQIKRTHAQAAVIVVSYRERPINDGRRMGICLLEDRSGQAEALSFDDEGKYTQLLSSDVPLLIRLQVSEDRREEGKIALRIEEARPLEAEVLKVSDQLLVRLRDDQCTSKILRELQETLAQHKGHCRVRAHVVVAGAGEVVVEAGENYRVKAEDELIGKLERLLGRTAARIG